MLVSWKEFEKYGNTGCILPKLNLELEEAEIIAIKSDPQIIHELFEIITGETKDYTGHFYCGERKDVYWIRRGDGLYEDLTVKEYLSLFPPLLPKKASAEAAEEWKNPGEHFALTDIWHKKIRTLSSPEKKRIHLARAILMHPKVLFIEDVLEDVEESEAELYRKMLIYIKEKQTAVILFTTIFEHAVTAGNVVYLYDKNGFRLLESAENSAQQDAKNSGVLPKICCRRNEQNFFFSPYEIDYVEAIKGNSCIYVGGEAFASTISLTELEEKISCYAFFRCHRSYLVNMQKIREITSYARGSYLLKLNTDDEAHLPLSRAKVEELKKRLEL